MEHGLRAEDTSTGKLHLTGHLGPYDGKFSLW